MYKVVISPSANADLFNALKYIAFELENPQAATKLADGIEKCYTELEEWRRDGGLLTQFSYEKGYFYGMAQTVNQLTGHITTSIVSSGAGYFQTPIRIGTDSEIVVVDLRKP